VSVLRHGKNIKHFTKKTDMLVLRIAYPGGMNITIRCYQPQPPFLDGSYKVSAELGAMMA
jgi:hypothetical protein